MPDGTIYTVLYDSVASTQLNTRVLGTAFRVRPDRAGIELVPFPGSPAYTGAESVAPIGATSSVAVHPFQRCRSPSQSAFIGPPCGA